MSTAKINFDIMVQNNLMDLIGGPSQLLFMQHLEAIDGLAHQISLKSSTPLKVKDNILTPTDTLYRLNHCVQMILALYRLSHINFHSLETLGINQRTFFLLSKILTTLQQQNGWFDITQIHYHTHKDNICAILENLWNETRGYIVSPHIEKDLKKREDLIKTERTGNSKIVSKLLRQHTNIQVSRFSCLITIQGNDPSLSINELETNILRLKSKCLDQIQQLNTGQLLCIQWRVQRSMGSYYLNMLVYHKDETFIVFPENAEDYTLTLNGDSPNAVMFILDQRIISISRLQKDNYQSDNLENWKVIFNAMLYPLRYCAYQSKTISANFQNIIY
ncbi:hypothetical protein F908_00502 [Acinetobacter sp. NIPH 284]|uniref:hypothetical protein n=1 Tax=Acinetobacter sp. NIPH 284 TaxID=1217704 RepID=UPI0002CE1858|nr:hypothetical protein [Acinetobacter sp. NIPH 284]ENW84455.1 hypothetical protein F908_00502 [Acinetobacter sp. NIPH 284]